MATAAHLDGTCVACETDVGLRPVALLMTSRPVPMCARCEARLGEVRQESLARELALLEDPKDGKKRPSQVEIERHREGQRRRYRERVRASGKEVRAYRGKRN